MTPTAIRALAAKGYTGDQIAEIAETLEEDKQQAERREQWRQASRTYRERHRHQASSSRHLSTGNFPTETTAASSSRHQTTSSGNGTENAQEESYLQTQRVRKKDSFSAHRIAVDWKPTEADRDWSVKHGMTLTEIERQAEGFLDYWKARGGEKARKTDWEATWRGWCRKFLDDNPRQLSLTGRTAEAIAEDEDRRQYYMEKRAREARNAQVQTH